MLKFTCKCDMEGVRESINELRSQVCETMDAVGRESVEYAKMNGTYTDVTGNLRNSNKYKVDERSLTIYNDAEYAADVEARGEDVLKGAALFAENRLKEIFE